MTLVDAEVEAGEVGLDRERLARIDRHFARYVDDGRLPGWQILVSRRGRVVHSSTYGRADRESDRPVTPDTIWRIYSMTKPITSVAAMMLYEEGGFELLDPVSLYIPSFADVRVYAGGPAAKPVTVAAIEPVRVWHLLTHTAGLTYGFHRVHPVDEMYRQSGFDLDVPADHDLADCCDAVARLPLLFQPGAEWNYSMATDVLGRIVEVVAGMPLDRFFAERIFGPLGMLDTGFWAAGPGRQDRLAALYAAAPGPTSVRFDQLGSIALAPPVALMGGGGLVSTAADYHRFAQMLLGKGELEGVRLLGSRTVEYMTRNHLPGGADLQSFGRPLFAETRFDGVGFGLGLAVVQDPAAYRTLVSAGEFNWGGMASTAFWVDPAEQIAVIFMTQLMPSSSYRLRTQLRQLVNQAIVD
jgi:CubicO group peptidase (beta-lactamase class C family)